MTNTIERSDERGETEAASAACEPLEAACEPLEGLTLDPSDYALFFDFDGVIADIAPRPDAVHVPKFRADVLEAWRTRANGALALVSGREIDDIASVFPDYDGAASGGHGAETRWPNGTRERREVEPETLQAVVEGLKRIAESDGAILYEAKRLGGVLHYRAKPELEKDVRARVRDLVSQHPAMEVQDAKMAAEVKPAGFSKGSVIEEFLDVDPFKGRTPFYAGDDTTDEAAFRVVNARGGVSIKVGEGETGARWRAASPDALFHWMSERVGLVERDAD